MQFTAGMGTNSKAKDLGLRWREGHLEGEIEKCVEVRERVLGGDMGRESSLWYWWSLSSPCFYDTVFLCVRVGGVLIVMGSRDETEGTIYIYNVGVFQW